MSKGNFSAGQPIFTQLLSFVPRHRINRIAAEFQADRYYKNLRTYEHLVTLLYGIFNRCNGLREVVTGLQAWEKRIQHLGINYQPRKSTLADANTDRSSEVFEQIYNDLYARYAHFLPDSRSRKSGRKLYIVDSTTISLFQEILKNAGRPPVNGKRKGGIKVHTLVESDKDVPSLVTMTAAAAADNPFLKHIHLPVGSVLIMDRGYVNDYKQLNRLNKEGVVWVSRLRANAVYKSIEKLTVTPYQERSGVLRDEKIVIGHNHHEKARKVHARLVRFRDPDTGKLFFFLTNGKNLTSTQVATYYKRRWQVESLFKRIKQNYPLSRFLGESENAIRIQIWCALIADMIVKIIKSKAARTWSFSNLTGTIRLHLMTYINLFSFLKNPERALLKRNTEASQLDLFPT